MAKLGGNFDANGVAPKEDFDIVPPAPYPVIIVASEMRPTKEVAAAGITQFKSDGSNNPEWQGYLWLEMDIASGPFKGRKLWDRLNLVNKNPKAVEIADRTLSAICHAVGVLNVDDSEKLHARPMLAKVKVVPAVYEQDGVTLRYAPKNEISTYLPMSAAQVTAPVATQVPAAPAAVVVAAAASAPQPGASAPWRK